MLEQQRRGVWARNQLCTVSTTVQHLLMSQVLASAATVGVTVVHGCTSSWLSRQSNGKTLPVGLFMEALLERTVKFI